MAHMRNECSRGELVRSLAGHDKSEIYIIIETDGAYVYLADGRIRTLDRPKKKKIKHVEPLGAACSEAALVEDTQIRKIIKKYKKEEVKEEIGDV